MMFHHFRHCWRGRLSALALTGLLIAGTGARVALICSPSFTLDADKAVVYLMAVQQSHGSFTALFWGQSYGGTLISTLAGALMWATSSASPNTVLGVTLVMTLLAAVLLWRITAVAFGQAAALVALALFLFPGAYLLRQSVDDGGFYASSLLSALTAVWLATDPGVGRRCAPLVRAALIGAAVGAALWCSPMGFVLAVPALVLLLRQQWRQQWRQRQPWRTRPQKCMPGLLLAAAATLLAASPYLLATALPHAGGGAQNHALTLSFAAVRERTRELVTQAIAAGLPLGHSPAAVLVVIGTVALGAVLLWNALHEPTGAAFGMALGAGLVVILLVVSGNPLDASSARYDEFLLPAFCFGTASAVTFIAEKGRAALGSVLGTALGAVFGAGLSRTLGAALSASAIAVTMTVLIASMPIAVVGPNQLVVATQPDALSSADRFGHDAMLVSRYLADQQIAAVWATYWLSYRVAAASSGTITAADIEYDRYPAARSAVAASSPGVIVVATGSAEESALVASTAPLHPSRDVGVGGASIFFYGHPLSEADVLALLPNG